MELLFDSQTHKVHKYQHDKNSYRLFMNKNKANAPYVHVWHRCSGIWVNTILLWSLIDLYAVTAVRVFLNRRF